MADFTPQEIEQFLQQFFDTVGARQYVGARYVPIFGRAGEDTVEWDDLAPYEPLTVVMHQGVSYVSRRYVPAGIAITDTAYWVETYRFNAQVEQYRQEVLSFQGQIDGIRADYVPFPDSDTYPKYGTIGQVLTTLTNGETKWEDPVVPSDAQAEAVITQWLNDHPEATTTVQDGSITEAKLNDSLSDRLIYDRYQFGGTDVNDIAENSFYYCTAGKANLPTNVGSYFIVTLYPYTSGNTDIGVQLAWQFSSGITYYRKKQSGTWSTWVHTSFDIDPSILIYDRYQFSGTDINNITENSFYYCTAGKTNLPTNVGAYFVMTIFPFAANNTTVAVQLAWQFSNGITYYRNKQSDTWGAWSKTSFDIDPTTLIFDRYQFSGTDINNITENSIYYCAAGKANLPLSIGSFLVQTYLPFVNNTDAIVQIAHQYSTGATYYRRKASGTWNAWNGIGAPCFPSIRNYYAFGDSLTWGAIWTATETDPYYSVTQVSKDNQIPTRIANATQLAAGLHNEGVGGLKFVSSGSGTIYNKIANTSMTDVGLITVAGGRNDSANPLGDHTSVVGDGTICGAIKQIIEYLIANYKKAQIVWIGVTPNATDNSTVFTRVFDGGWSLNTFDEKVSELCADYHIPYVSWKLCPYMNHWADYTGAGGNYAHPNNAESYLQMGNYIAGQVAQYYVG